MTYSGLTPAEFDNIGARYNPFRNDEFEIRRYGGSATHQFDLNADTRVITNLYVANFNRDWWRQSSTATDNQCRAGFTAARLAGVRVDPNLCNSAQGRLRSYRRSGAPLASELERFRHGQRVDNRLQTSFRTPGSKTDQRHVTAAPQRHHRRGQHPRHTGLLRVRVQPASISDRSRSHRSCATNTCTISGIIACRAKPGNRTRWAPGFPAPASPTRR